MKIAESQTWRRQAKCWGEDPRRWETASLNSLSRDVDAKLLCAGCPVVRECLVDARQSFRMSQFLGLFEPGDAPLKTSGVVRGGQVF